MRNHSCRVAKTLSLCLSVAFLIGPAVASAGSLTLYTDRDAFLAAANSNRLETFDVPTFGEPCGFIPPSFILRCTFDFGDVQIDYVNWDEIGLAPPRPLDDVVPVIPTGVRVNLPANTYAVGVDLLQAGITSFNIRFVDGVEWSNVYAPPGCIPFGPPPCVPFSGFVGVVAPDDNMSIPSFTAFATPPGILFQPPQASGYPAVLDNLVLRVPEPATALLLGVGFVGVCWRRRTTK